MLGNGYGWLRKIGIVEKNYKRNNYVIFFNKKKQCD